MPTQRLSLIQAATATSAGSATFTFPAPATDLVYLGTLVCNGAPAGATFIATVGGTQWGSWNGSAVGGPIQALPGEQIQVSDTGLTAATTYNLQWIGRSDSLSETSPAYPDTNASPAGSIAQPPGSSFSVQLIGGASQATATEGGAGTVALLGTPPPGFVWALHNANVTLGSGATQAQIVGNSTGFVYAQSFSSSAIFLPMAGQVAAEALNLVSLGGGASVWLSYDQAATPTGGGGVATPTIFQMSHSYSVIGTLSAQTLPPFFVPVMAGETAILQAVRTQLQSGTSIALALQQNGVNIGGLGAISVTAAATTTSPTSPLNLSNNDAIQAVLSSPVGGPSGLTISIYVQYT